MTPTAYPLAALIMLAATSAAPASDAADQIARGEAEYAANCASCHGPEGRGDGPVAQVMQARPTDLTKITLLNAGTFPAEELYRVISGQSMIDDHGSRSMPVWGTRFWQEEAATGAEDVADEVDARITALIAYIEGLQAE